MLTDRSRKARPLTQLALCSSLAIATALLAAPNEARAQSASGSFQGNGTFASGSGTITVGTGTTTINLATNDAVIDWTTFDTAMGGGPIDFQPSGTTATFQRASDFSVLNRILPTDPSRAVQFNGNVIAQIQQTTTTPGGSVYFYSPGGVIVGSTAVFDVGNLGLTSISPAVVGGQFEQTGTGGDEFVQFNGAVRPGSMVQVQAGAQITGGQYIALVAPVVDQRGTINTSAVAALVSADAVTLTFRNSGLFDIQVTSGTSGTGTTLFNNGSITGPASPGAGVNQRIYAVAVPKNDAITMVIGQGSNLGFNTALAAEIVGNQIVLSGGKDIVGGVIQIPNSPGGGSGLTDVQVLNSTLTSALTGTASNLISLYSTGGGTTTTTSDVTLTGNGEAEISSLGVESTTTVNGNATLIATKFGGTPVAGTTEIFANTSGTVNITGFASLDARAVGGGGAAGSAGLNATGGLAIIQALTGGTVTIGTGAGLNTVGSGGQGGTGGGAGGIGTGGRAQVFARDSGSSVTINGAVNALALGIGGLGNGGTGGAGQGGMALVNAQAASGASISILGATTLNAGGTGGNANSAAGGVGTGGTATVAASDGNAIDFFNNLSIFSIGIGGNGMGAGGMAGTGIGGAARLTLFQNGSINIGGAAAVNASGFTGMGATGTGTSVGGIASAIAQQNSVLDISGGLNVSSFGTGNAVPGAHATGGSAVVGASGNSSVEVAGVLRVRADGAAGNPAGTAGAGGNGIAGSAQVFANTGGDVLANELNVTAIGSGGADVGSGAGSGTGGTASLFAGDPGSTITIANGNSTGVFGNGELEFLSTHGFGGVSNGGGSGVGGNATGGATSITVNNGAVLNGPANGGSQGFVRIIARAVAGNANTGASAGGVATGGTINITVDNATMTSANLLPSSFAQAGSAITTATGNIAGGNATGGTRNITVNNGGSLTTEFGGGGPGAQGGNGLGTGAGGTGNGGSASLVVDNGSTLSLTGSSTVFSQNSGGAGGTAGMSGGATAGNAFVRVANGSTMTMAGPTTNTFGVNALAFGTLSPTGSLTSSNLTGGNATFLIENATANLQTVTVGAIGGDSNVGFVAQGGTGTGGNATLQLIGATLNADSVRVDASGFGGTLEAGQSGVAGNAFGGIARIIATGGTSTATIAQFAEIFAVGDGGNIRGAPGTTTGNGTGGTARLAANSGASLSLNVPVIRLNADGEGGRVGPMGATADIGGDGTGGLAEVFANSGNLAISGNLSLEADNLGGEGIVGGDGLRRTDGLANALLHARNGSITVGGLTSLSSQGQTDSDGAGGNAAGGQIVVDAENSLAGPSTITLNGLGADASATGGGGNSAPSPTSPGGDGGDAFGGNVQVFGNAGNGNLVVNGISFFNALAFGGAGGTGHTGATGTPGGAGGNATGGSIQFGTRSGNETVTSNTGSAQFNAVQAQSNAFGGAGGVGGAGTTQGAGGAGGDAQGGATTLLVRGSPVAIDLLQPLEANATGGAGGTGATQGVGGDATVGGIGGAAVVVTSRFMQPTQLGSLTANDIDLQAIATGGSGSTAGGSFVGDSPLTLEFSGASGTVGSIEMVAQGGTVTGTVPSAISLTSGTLDIARTLALSTPGPASVTLDRFTVNVANLSLEAGNFVLAATRPATLGTFNVSSGGLQLISGLDFLAYANFDVGGGGFFDFTGSVLTGDLTFDDEFGIEAGGSITTGAVIAGGEIDLVASGTATTGQLTAGEEVQVSAGGAVMVAGASSGIINPSTDPEAEYNIGLRSLTSIVAGDLTARGSVGVVSPGSITVGNIVTGPGPLGIGFLALAGTGLTTGSIDTTASTSGGRVYLANFSMESLGGELGNEFDPTPILAATPVAIGGPISLGGAVSTGRFQAATTGAFTAQAITAPNLFQLATGADVTLGDLSSFIVNVSSAASLTTGSVTSTATAAQLAALSQTNGVVLTAANSLTTGAIQAGGGVSLDAGAAVAVGSVNAGTSIGIDAGQGITGAAMIAGGLIEVEAGGAIMLGNLTGGQSVNVETSSGTLSVGNVAAGPDPITQFSIGLLAEGNLTAGNLTGNGSIGLLSNTGSITAGSISATRSLLALARGAVSLGGVTTGTTASDFAYIANSSMVSLGGALDDSFNPAPIFAAAPVATTGPITINGSVSTGNLIAATTGALSIGGGATPANLDLAGRLNLIAGGPLAVGNVIATGIRLQSGSTITGGALTSREAINVNGAGAVTLGNLSATTSGAARDIAVASTGASVSVGTVAAGGDVRFDAGGGNLTTGTITAGDDVLLLARDAVSVGAITASTTEGRITIANASLRALDPVDVDADAIFNATATPVTGAISIGGPVSGTTFRAASTGDFTASALTLTQSIRIDRAALLQVNGAWVAPTINLASQRVAFGTASGAGIGGAGTTNLTLRALASGQTAVLGGTTAGPGYTLTQADFGRIRAGNLTVQVDRQGASGGAPDLEIRDLTLNGSAGSGFAATTITTPGRIRVTGDLVLQQAGAMDTLNVNATDRLEIVLPEGSIAITGAGGALAGTLTLSSNNLVAGTLDILQQVMADPEAAGLAEALKTPASSSSNLAGYIRAEGVKLLSNANILLQNSGTARDFAGVTAGGGGLIIGRISPASGGATGGGSTGGGTTTTSGFSFTGMLASPNEILMFEFRVDANSEVTLRTYSYAGGANAAGQVIPAGGFDPILALFDAAGALIGQNDDGGSNVPADPVTGSRFDTFFQPSAPLAPGTYTVSVSVFSNFAIGPNISNGFEMNETSFGTGRTANFAFDVLGAATATGPGSMTPTSSGPLNVIGFGRQQTATGTTTGEAFFTGINFGTSGANPLVYTDLSQFNTCLVNGGTCSSVVPMNTPLAPPASEITVIVTTPLATSPPPPAVDDAGPGDSSGSASESEAADESDSGEGESQDEDESDGEGEDEAASPIAPPTPLISTRALDGDVRVVEPVSGAGNPALFGSAVNETTVEGEKP